MPADLHHLLTRWFEEVWNQGREETIDELFAPDCVGHGLSESDTDTHGPEGFKAFVRNMRGAMPDVHVVINDFVANGETAAAVRVTMTGTHAGPGLGVAPTGNAVSIGGLLLIHFRNGKIVEGWHGWDQLGFMRQIGALPAAPMADAESDRFVRAHG